jgi:nitrous oxidase accessory protein
VGCIRAVVRLGLAAALVACSAPSAWAERIIALPGGSLQDLIDRAADGDVVVLKAGEHHGAIRITRQMTVEGEPGAILTGPGSGSVVTVSAPGAVVRNLTIRGSGSDLEKMDSGVFIEKPAVGARVEGSRVEGNLYGVYRSSASGPAA